jgi:hypothetical protein
LVVGLGAVAVFLIARIRQREQRDLARILIDEQAKPRAGEDLLAD